MKYISVIALVIAVVALGFVAFRPNLAPTPFVGSASTNTFGTSGIATIVIASSTTATTTLATADANRRAVFFWNSGLSNASCLLSSTSTGYVYAGGTFFLASSTGTYVLDATKLYVGPVWCLTQTGTTSISVTVGK